MGNSLLRVDRVEASSRGLIAHGMAGLIM